jgi:hypothetical protein
MNLAPGMGLQPWGNWLSHPSSLKQCIGSDPFIWTVFVVDELLGRITEIQINQNDSFDDLSPNKCGLWKSSIFMS